MTWPLASKMWNCLPKDLGDPLIVCWILAWDINKFETGLTGFWNANIFHPNKLTLAYAEYLIPIVLTVFPWFFIR